MSTSVLRHYLNEFENGRDVASSDAEALFQKLIGESNQNLLADVLSAWNDKGVTEDELFSFATIMRKRMKKIALNAPAFVDPVGTGGSGAKTFNVSTTAAFVIAGAGLPVAKHGNRAATSSSGSADVLSMLGIDVDVDISTAERCFYEFGLCFMFAPRYHSLSPVLAAARRAVKKPTIFNNLGPLCNPAMAPHQVIGVSNQNMLQKTARVLARLGTKRSWVVNAAIGLDEIALEGQTRVFEVSENGVDTFEVNARDFGVEVGNGDLPVGCAAESSARLITQILNNEAAETGAEDLVLINSAAALYVGGCSSTLPDAYRMAKESVRSGAAREKMMRLASETSR
ncbi:MAG: anthranilate phosphoribosyltransferase [Pyrinomonadaceae bacterium]